MKGNNWEVPGRRKICPNYFSKIPGADGEMHDVCTNGSGTYVNGDTEKCPYADSKALRCFCMSNPWRLEEPVY